MRGRWASITAGRGAYGGPFFVGSIRILAKTIAQGFRHRRDWMVDVQRLFAGLFGVEICFHAELSNHLHLVLRSRPDVVEHWNDGSLPIFPKLGSQHCN